jgi:hypothetical protein
MRLQVRFRLHTDTGGGEVLRVDDVSGGRTFSTTTPPTGGFARLIDPHAIVVGENGRGAQRSGSQPEAVPIGCRRPIGGCTGVIELVWPWKPAAGCLAEDRTDRAGHLRRVRGDCVGAAGGLYRRVAPGRRYAAPWRP